MLFFCGLGPVPSVLRLPASLPFPLVPVTPLQRRTNEGLSAAVDRLRIIHDGCFAVPMEQPTASATLIGAVAVAMASVSASFVATHVLPALLSDRHGTSALQTAGFEALHRLLTGPEHQPQAVVTYVLGCHWSACDPGRGCAWTGVGVAHSRSHHTARAHS